MATESELKAAEKNVTAAKEALDEAFDALDNNPRATPNDKEAKLAPLRKALQEAEAELAELQSKAASSHPPQNISWAERQQLKHAQRASTAKERRQAARQAKRQPVLTGFETLLAEMRKQA